MGGGPSYPKPTNEEKALQREQISALSQQREITQKQFQQQELLQPLIYKQLNLKPVMNESGQITGFDEGPPTPEQEAARSQSSALQEQLRVNQLLQPYAFRQQGLEPKYGEDGKISGFSEIPLPPNPNAENEGLQRDLEKQFYERTQQALAGNLPVDPSLQRSLDTSEGVLRETLRKQLGPGFDTSTPGIEALANFDRSKQELLYGAAHGEIGFSNNLALANQQGGINQSSANLNQSNSSRNALQGLSNGIYNASSQLQPLASLGYTPASIQTLVGGVGAPYQGQGGSGSLSSLYNNPLAYLAQQRAQQYGAAQQSQQAAGSTGALIGTGLGAIAGGYFGGPGGVAAGGALGGAVGGYTGRAFG